METLFSFFCYPGKEKSSAPVHVTEKLIHKESLSTQVKYTDELAASFIESFDMFILIDDNESLTQAIEDFVLRGNYDAILKKIHRSSCMMSSYVYNNYDGRAISELRTYRSSNDYRDSVFLIGITSSNNDKSTITQQSFIKLLEEKDTTDFIAKATVFLKNAQIGAINVKEYIYARPSYPGDVQEGSITMIGKIQPSIEFPTKRAFEK